LRELKKAPGIHETKYGPIDFLKPEVKVISQLHIGLYCIEITDYVDSAFPLTTCPIPTRNMEPIFQLRFYKEGMEFLSKYDKEASTCEK